MVFSNRWSGKSRFDWSWLEAQLASVAPPPPHSPSLPWAFYSSSTSSFYLPSAFFSSSTSSFYCFPPPDYCQLMAPKALKGYTNPTNPPYITKSNPTSWQYPLPKLWPSRLKTKQASFVLTVIIFETLSQMLLQIKQCVLDTSNICLYSSDVKINIKAQSATWYFWCFRATLGSSSW